MLESPIRTTRRRPPFGGKAAFSLKNSRVGRDVSAAIFRSIHACRAAKPAVTATTTDRRLQPQSTPSRTWFGPRHASVCSSRRKADLDQARGRAGDRDDHCCDSLGESRDPKASSHDDHQFESPPLRHALLLLGAESYSSKIRRPHICCSAGRRPFVARRGMGTGTARIRALV